MAVVNALGGLGLVRGGIENVRGLVQSGGWLVLLRSSPRVRARYSGGPYLEERLATLRDLPIVGDVRGKCFMMCVENVADQETRALLPADAAVGNRIAAHAQKRGVIVRPIAHLNVLSPPLTMSKRQVDELVGVLRDSIVETMDDLRRDGLSPG